MARVYDNTARELRARRTRARIVTTARDLLLDGGYAAMTIASLSEAAGVSPQTIYNAVGGKPAVVKAVYDVMLAGDDDPAPMSERPEFLAMADAPDREAFMAAYAGWSRAIADRVGTLIGVLLEHGPGTDAMLAEFVATIERERRTGNSGAMRTLSARHGLPGHCAGEGGFERLVDGVWVLTAPDLYDRLVRRRGWPPEDYQDWLTRQLTALLRG